MDLSKIVAISGFPDLYKIIGPTKNGVIVEGLFDKKRFPAFASHKISALEEISVYTDSEPLSLKDILKKIYDKEDKKETIDHKSDSKTLKQYFEEIIPNYDKERVYVSDMKKVLKWYNLLFNADLIDFKEEKKKVEKEKNEKSEKKEDNKKTKIKRTEKKEEHDGKGIG